MNTAYKSSGGGPLDPHQTPILHINTEKKINIKTLQQLNMLSYMLFRSQQKFMQNIESHVLPLLLNPRITHPPFFFAIQKFVAV